MHDESDSIVFSGCPEADANPDVKLALTDCHSPYWPSVLFLDRLVPLALPLSFGY